MPEDIISLVDDVDEDIIDLDSINEVVTNQFETLTSDENESESESESSDMIDGEYKVANLRKYKKKDKDKCYMKGSETFQLKMYWKKRHRMARFEKKKSLVCSHNTFCSILSILIKFLEIGV